MILKEDLPDRVIKTLMRKLTVEKYAQSMLLGTESLHIDAIYDYVLEGVDVRFSRKLLCEDTPVITLSIPLNWWEHFKLDVMPTWFIKRYPIKFRVVERNFRVMYPHYKLNNDILGRGYLEIMETEYESNYI